MRAMILAAGRGTRLKQLTQVVPKCLVEVGGVPMLGHVAKRLQAAGVNEVVINLHHLADAVRARVEHEVGFGLEVEFSFEPKLLGTGGGLRKVQSFFPKGEPFIVINADIYCELPLGDLVAAHRQSDRLASLVTMNREDSSYLLFDSAAELKGYEIVGKRTELTNSEVQLPALHRGAFCGIQVLSPKIFDYMDVFPEEFSLIDVYLRAAKRGQHLTEYSLGSHYWVDMGTPENLELLKERLDTTNAK